mmetsp:Transcript_45842/g.103043  ORF Transcript_45842/g.103043 Transcript_45842/m.103043 type:complete len:266 (-) Transcript_45842:21-818(-)
MPCSCFLATVAGAGAVTPLAPQAPLAVLLAAWRIVLARPRLSQDSLAAITLRAAEVHNLAAAHLLCYSTTPGAIAPCAPIAQSAVLLVARLFIASPDLDQVVWTELAVVLWKSVDLALSAGLTTTTGLVAVVPRGPVRDPAVHHVLRAGLRLFECTTAGGSLVRRHLHDLAVTVPLPVHVTGRPLAPGAKLAVLLAGMALTLLTTTTVQLLEGTFALLTATDGRFRDRPETLTEATAAGSAASAPIPPLAELTVTGSSTTGASLL